MALPIVVPAAGAGTRMGEATDGQPKGLVQVGGEPLLHHVLGAVPEREVAAFIVVTGGADSQIESTIGSRFRGKPVEYVTQPEPVGLADAVGRAEPHVDEPFVVVNGDNVFETDLGPLIESHRDTDADATLLVEDATVEKARTGGVCVLDDDGRLATMLEKPEDPPSTLVSAGAFVFEPVVFHAIRLLTTSDRGEFELPDAIDLLLRAGRPVETVRLDGARVNVNTPADVRAAERMLEA